MRNIPGTWRRRRCPISASIRRSATRFVDGQGTTAHPGASPNVIPEFGTDIYSSVKADFGRFRAELLHLHPDGKPAGHGVPRHGRLYRGEIAIQRRPLGYRRNWNSPTGATTSVDRSSASRTAANTSVRQKLSRRAAKGEQVEEVVTLESSKLNQKVHRRASTAPARRTAGKPV